MGGTGLNGRNSRPRADLENPFDNDAVTGLQAPRHNPESAFGAAHFNITRLDLIVLGDDKHIGFARWCDASSRADRA